MQLYRGDISSTADLISFNSFWNAFVGMWQVLSSENWVSRLGVPLPPLSLTGTCKRLIRCMRRSAWQQRCELFPLSHFRTSQMATGYHQKVISAIFLSAWLLFGNFVILQVRGTPRILSLHMLTCMPQMFIAVINENFEVAEEVKRRRQLEVYERLRAPMKLEKTWLQKINPYNFVRPAEVGGSNEAKDQLWKAHAVEENDGRVGTQAIHAGQEVSPASKLTCRATLIRHVRSPLGREHHDYQSMHSPRLVLSRYPSRMSLQQTYLLNRFQLDEPPWAAQQRSIQRIAACKLLLSHE